MPSRKPDTRSKRTPAPGREKQRSAAGIGRSKRTAEPEPARQAPVPPTGDREMPRRGFRAEVSRSSLSAATDAAVGASRRAFRATPLIVQKAASILEEEVATGIGAAKRIEQRFLDVAALRAQPPDAVMSRFRRDAHEAVDIILDIVTAAATTVGERAGRIVNVTAGHTTSPRPARSSAGPGEAGESGLRIATVRIPGKVKPGAIGELLMSLENESDRATAEFTLHSAELVSASGARIPADHVSFEPRTLSVGPRSAGQVTVSVRVPAKADAGVYEGLVRATEMDALRALLTIDVG
ncbi:MAG: hypothetical protein MNPFHGCM_02956 [Gemmatimonadaceae bacterium]|nr:hypothetical protein [Gemmatimonadaceae bacterium]